MTISACSKEMLNKAIHGFIQLASSRCMPGTGSANQGLSPLFALGHPAPSRMLKKGCPALFQLGSSRSEFATASEH